MLEITTTRAERTQHNISWTSHSVRALHLLTLLQWNQDGKGKEQHVREKLFFCFFWWEMLSSQEIRNRCARGHTLTHTHTHPCSTLKNTRFQFSDMKEAPVEWKEKWKSSLLSVSHKQRACGALTGCRSLSSSETHSTSTKSVGTCFKGVQNGNLHYSCTVKNGKINLVYSTAKVWLFALQKLKTEVTGYLYFIIYSMQQSLNLALLFLSC